MAETEKGADIPLDESDALIERNRGLRAAFFIASVIAAGLIPGIVGAWLVGMLDFPGTPILGLIIGMMMGQLAFAKAAPLYFVTVPQAQAFVTLNDLMALFGKKGNPNNTFGPGKSLEWPWVTRGRRSNLSLQIITIRFKENVPGKDTQLLVTGSYQFKVDIRKASRFVGVDESTIRGGAIDLILAEISHTLSEKSADDAKKEIKIFNEKLGAEFGVRGHKHDEADDKVKDFEARYGIASVEVTISGIDLPEDVQKTRDAIDEATQAVKSVAAMFGMTEGELKRKLQDGTISVAQYTEMLDRTLAQGRAATMNIQAFKLGGVEAAVEFLNKLRGGK